jgi:hypothetical protein
VFTRLPVFLAASSFVFSSEKRRTAPLPAARAHAPTHVMTSLAHAARARANGLRRASAVAVSAMRRLAFPAASVGSSRRATTSRVVVANAATNKALARSAARKALAKASASRAFSAGIDPDAGSKIPSQLHDAERAREDMYFRAEDAKALEKLMRKAREQAREESGEDPVSSDARRRAFWARFDASPKRKADEWKQLRKIVPTVNEETIRELVEWKHLD